MRNPKHLLLVLCFFTVLLSPSISYGYLDCHDCQVCGYQYQPCLGDPENGIPEGTKFEDLPSDWVCPQCGSYSSQFELHTPWWTCECNSSDPCYNDPCSEGCEDREAQCEVGCCEGQVACDEEDVLCCATSSDCCDDPCRTSCESHEDKCAAGCFDADCCEDPPGDGCTDLYALCSAGVSFDPFGLTCTMAELIQKLKELLNDIQDGDVPDEDDDAEPPIDETDEDDDDDDSDGGGPGSPPNPGEKPNKKEDDDDNNNDGPGDGDPCGKPGSSGGEGLHIHFGKGHLWTVVKAFKAKNAEGTDVQFKLAYNSLSAKADTDPFPVGYGWAHNYDMYLVRKKDSWNRDKKVIFVDGTGRRHSFVCTNFNTKRFRAPLLRSLTLTWDVDHYEVSDPNGTTWVFGTNDMIESISDRRGRIVRFYYDSEDRLSEILSPYGKTVSFTYYPGIDGLLHTITAPDQTQTTLTYTNGNLMIVEDPLGHSQTFLYDSQNRMIQETLKNGRTYYAEYNDSATPPNHAIFAKKDASQELVYRVSCVNGFPSVPTDETSVAEVLITDGRGKVWKSIRDFLGRIVSTTSPGVNGKTRGYEFDTEGQGAAVGTPSMIFDELGNKHYFERDEYGNLVKYTDKLGNITEYEYNHPLFPMLRTRIIESDTDAWEYVYNSFGMLKEVIDPLDDTEDGETEDCTLKYEYTFWGATEAPGTVACPLPGRLKTKTRIDRNGKKVRNEYDSEGNLEKVIRDPDTLHMEISYNYDVMGRMTERVVEVDATQTVKRRWVYDNAGRLDYEVRDPDGENLQAHYVWDEYGNLKKTINPEGVETEYFYDHRNRLSKNVIDASTATESEFLETVWEYDGNGNTVKILDQGGGETSLEYDDLNKVVHITDPEDYETWYSRDYTGRITGYHRSKGKNPSAYMVDPSKYESMFQSYDAIGRLLTRTIKTNPSDLVTTYEYLPEAGGCGCSATPGSSNPFKITDPWGKITWIEYDVLDRKMRVVKQCGYYDDPTNGESDDAINEYDYYPSGQLKSVTNPLGEKVAYSYDSASRLKHVSAVNPSGNQPTREINYNLANQVVSELSATGNLKEYGYDTVGRLTSITDDTASIIFEYDVNSRIISIKKGGYPSKKISYDNAGRVIREYDSLVESPIDRFLSFNYDVLNRTVEVIDHMGVVTRTTKDGLGRKILVTVDPTGINQSVQYEYDGLGRLIEVKDCDNNSTVWQYDGASRIVLINYPDSSSSQNIVYYNYSSQDDSITMTNQKGTETCILKDDFHRPETIIRTLSGHPVEMEMLTYDKLNRMLTASNGSTQAEYSYGDIGYSATGSQTYRIGGTALTSSSIETTNTVDYHQTLVYPNPSRVIRSEYLPESRLDRVYDQGLALTLVDYEYDALHRVYRIDWGNNAISYMSTDSLDRPVMIQHYDGLGIRQYAMINSYDANSSVVTKFNYQNSSCSEKYTLDTRRRLVTFERGELSSDWSSIQTPLDHPYIPNYLNWPASGGLDGRGNWTSFEQRVGSGSVPPAQTRTVNAANEIIAIDPDGPNNPLLPVFLSYDELGSLTVDPLVPNAGTVIQGQIYGYDLANRLTSITRSDGQALMNLEYDALGRRVRTTEYIDLTTGLALVEPRIVIHYYSDRKVLADYLVVNPGSSETYTLLREYVWGGKLLNPVAMIDYTNAGGYSAGTPEVFYYHNDSQGNIVAITDAQGSVVEKYTYDPYGNTYIEDSLGIQHEKSLVDNPWMWTGQRYDPVTGLYHFAYRSYSPHLGRWLQRDPKGYVNGLNLYEYCMSNPMNWVDPLGLNVYMFTHKAFGRTGLGVGAIHAGILIYDQDTKTYEVYEIGKFQNRDPRGRGLIPGTKAVIQIGVEVTKTAQTPFPGNDVIKYPVDLTGENDNKFRQAAMTIQPGKYGLTSNNCVHYTRAVIEAAGGWYPLSENLNHDHNLGTTSQPQNFTQVEKAAAMLRAAGTNVTGEMVEAFLEDMVKQRHFKNLDMAVSYLLLNLVGLEREPDRLWDAHVFGKELLEWARERGLHMSLEERELAESLVGDSTEDQSSDSSDLPTEDPFDDPDGVDLSDPSLDDPSIDPCS